MNQPVNVINFDMPFGSIVTFMIKFYFASTLAAIAVFGAMYLLLASLGIMAMLGFQLGK